MFPVSLKNTPLSGILYKAAPIEQLCYNNIYILFLKVCVMMSQNRKVLFLYPFTLQFHSVQFYRVSYTLWDFRPSQMKDNHCEITVKVQGWPWTQCWDERWHVMVAKCIKKKQKNKTWDVDKDDNLVELRARTLFMLNFCFFYLLLSSCCVTLLTLCYCTLMWI